MAVAAGEASIHRLPAILRVPTNSPKYASPKSATEFENMGRSAIFEASVDFFLSPVREYLVDDSVTEVMINGYRDIYVERRGRIERTNAQFASEDALLSAVHNIAQWCGREISPSHPVLDARLPSGSRVNAVIPPSATGGTYLTIRKFSKQALTLDDLIRYGSLSEMAREFLQICVRLHKNTIISGGTGTGKTSMLGAVSQAIPDEERIIVIEDTAELRLRQRHCLYLEANRPDAHGHGGLSVRQLFVNSLRMRPDRIIVGEVRSGEALDLVQSMISGHAGSLSTVHASTPRDALVRLETLSLMSDVELPIYVARAQVGSAINLIIQISRIVEDGSRKVTRITEALGLDENNQYRLHDLFVRKFHGRSPQGALLSDLELTGNRPTFWSEPRDQGLEGLVRLSAPLFSEGRAN